MRKIVIIGAGFGGIYTYKKLCRRLKWQHKDAKITVIAPDNYFLFSPMLHEVATGGLNLTNVVQPIREIIRCSNDEFVQEKATKINLEKNVVELSSGAKIDYDILVLGIGASTAFYGVNGAQENALQLKTLRDAARIRNKCLHLMQKACEPSFKVSEGGLNWSIIGCGPTGVELAAELAEYAKDFAERAPNFPINKLAITLYDSNDQILKNFNPKISHIAAKVLKSHNIKILNKQKVSLVTEEGIEVNGKIAKSKCIIWTAGVAANKIDISPAPEYKRDQLLLTEHLTLPNFDNVYVVGDMAYVENVPQTGQAAVAMGKYVAKKIAKSKFKKPFKFNAAGMLISLGQWKSAGNIGPFIISGLFGWWVWRTIYLSKLLGIPNKIRTVIDWNIDMFYRRDIAEL